MTVLAAVLLRRLTRPALEGAVEGAALGEAKAVGDVLDAAAVAELGAGVGLAGFVDQIADRAALER
jgi:hypothetical protein